MIAGRATDSFAPYVPRLVVEWLSNGAPDLHRRIEGTLVFADLSGFTATSERLATMGRVGAEELTHHLDSTFTALLDVAAARQGCLLKFGGDALLLFFWGDDHARRAVASAAEMRSALRAAGRLRTSVGPIRLRMSIGVHSGSVDLFLVGGDRRQLIVGGGAATAVVTMEAAADAGEILLSPDTAGRLGASAQGALKGPGVLLARPPKPPIGPVAPQRSGVDVSACVAPVVRAALERGDPDGEHRWLTIGFAHLAGVDNIIAADGPDYTAAILDQVARELAATVARHELWDLDCDLYHGGPKFIVVGGAPAAHENDAERVLRAMTEVMGTALSDARLAWRIGVHRGLAFSGPVGPAYRRTLSVMGDAVNTAARVMGHASPRQLLVTPGVLDRSAATFSAQPCPPFQAKGKAEPIRVFAVGGAIEDRVPAGSYELPFVGRTRELERLRMLLDAGGPVQITGDAGIGKTRLIAEALAGLTTPVIRTGCDEYGLTSPYSCARPLLRAALGSHSVGELGIEPSWLPLMGPVLGLDLGSTPETEGLDPQFAANRVAEVARQLVAATCPGPTVWVIDDAQWVDHASAALLPVALPGVLLYARRPGDTGLTISGVYELDLGPLEPADARALATVAVGRRLLPDRIDAVAARSGGNAMHIRELAAAGQAEGELPDRLETSITSRLDLLPPAARDVVLYASVLGRSFDAQLLEAVSPGWQATGVDEFLEVDGRIVRFRHRLHQEVAYAGLSFRTRRALHEQAGRVIEDAGGEPPIDVLSLHFAAARQWDRAWRYSLAAGQRAKAAFANLDAAGFYQRAVEAARHVAVDPGDLGDAWAALAYAHFYALRLDEADAVARQARLALRDDPVQVARQYMVSAEIARRRREHSVAIRRCRAGLRRLAGVPGGGAAGQRSRLLSVLATVAADQGHGVRAVRLAEEMLASAETAGDRRAVALARYVVFACLLGNGEHHRALAIRATVQRGLETERAFWQLAAFHNSVAVTFDRLGDWRAATDSYGAAARTAEQAGAIHDVALPRFNEGRLASRQGRLEVAEQLMHAALGVWEPAGFDVGIACAEQILGEIAGCRGDWDGARRSIESSAARFEALTMPDYVAEAAAAMALAAALTGRPSEALDAAPDETGDADVDARACRARGLAHALLGDAAAARSGFERAGQLSDYEGAMGLHFWAQQASAIGPPPDGWRQRVTEVFERLDVVWVPTTPGGAPVDSVRT